MVDLYVRLPKVGKEMEANTLEILHRLVDVDDPGVLLSLHIIFSYTFITGSSTYPLDSQVHGQSDAGFLVAYLRHIFCNLKLCPSYRTGPGTFCFGFTRLIKGPRD